MSIVEYYEEQPIEFIQKEGKRWITTKSIAVGLGVSKDTIHKIYRRNKEELEDESSILNLPTESSKVGDKSSITLSKPTRCFNEDGFILLCMFSRSPKAKLFRKWAVQILRQVGRQGFYISPDTDLKSVIEYCQGQIQTIQHKVEDSQQNFLQLSERNEKFENFIQKYEEERLICDETMKEIRNRIYWHHKTKNYWLWVHLRKKFGFSKLGRLTEIRAIAVLKYLKQICY